MIADLHAHYPMHVAMEGPRATVDQMRKVRARPRGERFRGFVLNIASRLLSDRTWSSGHRVTVPLMQEGGVRLAFSVLYSPFDEMDFSEPYGAAPESGYFGRLVHQLEQVEQDLNAWGDDVVHVKDEDTLDEAIKGEKVGLVHCVEGGFHLGDSEDEIRHNVGVLADKGVAYITLAHLFWRQIATNAPAIPFLRDRCYDRLFPQPKGEGLTSRGRAAVEAMVKHRVLVDLSHMHPDSVTETLDLLDKLDPKMPVISSHAGYRFGKQTYMVDEPTVRRIADREGLIGLIMAQHQLNDGIRRCKTRKFKTSFDVIRRHINRIHDITKDYDHVALGTDLDGFIKPTMGGIETMADLESLEEALIEEYGAAGKLIACDNAVRVLRGAWGPRGAAQAAPTV